MGRHMKIESYTFQQFKIAKKTGIDSCKDINITPCPNNGSHCKDIIEVQQSEIKPSRPFEPINEDSVQKCRKLSQGWTLIERIILNRVAIIYQNRASIFVTNYKNRIDIRI